MQKNLTTSEIKQHLSSINSQYKSETILKAQEFLKEYEINLEALIGAGGFGVVLKAQDNINNRVVAVKIIICQDANNVKDSLKEFQKMKLLRSENIIASYDIYYDENNEAIYIITEFGTNGDLASYLRVNKSLSKQKIIQIFDGIIEGLKAVHEKNIIHADLKPANIILSDNNIPKICDFGLSKKLINKNYTVIQGGTPNYAPKEQIDGKIYKESDLFSAGMILCVLCGLQLEDNILQNLQMKEGKFPDISNHQNKDLLQIAFQMMNSDHTKRITLNQTKQMLNVPSDRYEGQYKGQKRHGKGKQFWDNGDIYDGEWIEDKITGFGIYQFAESGDRYEGYFKDGQRNGKGKQFYANGDIYDGEWIEDNITGFGIFKSKSGNRYEGYFKDGQMNGKGKNFWDNGDIYDGEWIENKITGFGILKSAKSGDRYEGYFNDGQRNGQGKQFYANGSIKEGVWKDNQIQQQCRIF